MRGAGAPASRNVDSVTRGPAPPARGSSLLEDPAMKGLLNFLGMTIGGWLGWVLGARVSLFTAFVVGMVGTGLGLYAAQRILRRILP